MPDRRSQRTSNSSFDPLNINLQPPANETEEQKAARLEAAWEATQVSRTIDAGLAESKKALEKKKRAVKILLLGQSESGKSSVLRNFRLSFTPKYFENERLVWKTVIQLNLINSIKKILTVLQEEWEELETDSAESKHEPALTSEHRRLALSLSPLLAFETSISRIMESSTGDYTVTVRPGGGWKDKLASFGHRSPSTPEAQSPTGETDSDPSQVTQVLAACKNEMIALWDDAIVRGVLERHGVYLQDDSGFFLDDTARIAALDYIPSDRDIMRARIKTLGVEEHRFVTESGFRAGTEFYITDLVCALNLTYPSQRSTWVPYFDDVQAILFLAPLAFWQSLDEDSKVNRVQDSLELWREIVGNPLLAKTAFILLFNKKDVLQAHIAAGVQVKKYVPSFGDRPNDVASVTKCTFVFSVADFRDKFSAYHRKFSPEPRPFIFYETEAIDTKSTAIILGEVQEQIIRNHLKDLDVM
ncbi:G-protein alpha subunit [Mycena albidolilacea]|uniref:G-protein alpha subunit n=1 Tax=Mycena albidolilacea TaxID=1033008 RepID=A0AAD6ZNG8_9AGAR|nr:G-protein alpha subunit [Mycena albidolilacea]